jgi:hypothetical protein
MPLFQIWKRKCKQCTLNILQSSCLGRRELYCRMIYFVLEIRMFLYSFKTEGHFVWGITGCFPCGRHGQRVCVSIITPRRKNNNYRPLYFFVKRESEELKQILSGKIRMVSFIEVKYFQFLFEHFHWEGWK